MALEQSSLFRQNSVWKSVVGMWTEVTLAVGEVLWRQHASATELGFVLDGQLAVHIGDEEVATIGAGELVGESCAFVRGEVRTGTVVATTEARIATLGCAELRAIRESHTSVYDLLLDQALKESAARVSSTDERISALTRADRDAPSRPPSKFQNLWSRMTGGLGAEPPPILPTLRLLPVMRDASENQLLSLASTLKSRLVSKDTALFLEEDQGDTLFLVGSGSVRVLRAASDGGAYLLATLGRGSLFGTGALLGGGRRTASCVAEEDTWVHSMDRGAFERLDGEVGRLWREALLCAMRAQLLGADLLLAALKGRANWRQFGDEVSFDQLLAAAGSVLAWKHTEEPAPSLFTPEAYAPIVAEDPNKRRLIEYIRSQVIGANEALEMPYGLTRITYADYTASGRSLRCIEDFIQNEVMPLYANTHTEASGTGRQTTAYREDARRCVAEAVGATDDDAVIFVGSGATGAVHRAVEILNLRIPEDLDARWGLSGCIPADQRPVIFVGPYEHHSNILPWLHSIADVVVVEDDEEGRVDLADLERNLDLYADRPLKIGSFSAASNVTGIVTETAPVAILLHRHGALSFWDFAAAGPYTEVAMNQQVDGPEGHLAYKDGVFLSPHKFIGGPGTPGLLVLKRNLIQNTVPSVPGGGTVALVTPEDTVYWDHAEHREEGGTPAILESIRCGLVFRLKDEVGVETIESLESAMVQRAIETWSSNPSIRVLGSPRAKRLSIVSVMVRHGNRYVHNNFIVTLLNDLFGVQARGGCSCAGPYMHRLLGVGPSTSRKYVEAVRQGRLSLKPGWARVNFNYFISATEFDYIVETMDLVARHGWAMMGDYDFDTTSGQWLSKTGTPHEPMRLTNVRFSSGQMAYPSRHACLPESVLADQLTRGRDILLAAVEAASSVRTPVELMDDAYEQLRWFVLPHEVLGQKPTVNE